MQQDKARGRKPGKVLLYGFGIDTKCKTCGAKFVRPSADWGYKLGDKLYCTYSCMREAERKMKKRV